MDLRNLERSKLDLRFRGVKGLVNSEDRVNVMRRWVIAQRTSGLAKN